jgi:phage repressor protein C with HTH and peptisase S24 domain
MARTDSIQREQQAARLKEARTRAGFATAAAALQKYPRWKQSTYLAHENGQNGVPPDASIDYGRAFDVDPGWILTGVGRGPKGSKKTMQRRDSQELVELGEQTFTPIGRFDASFSMGPGSLVAERPEPLGYWLIETQWLRGLTVAMPAELAIVRVSGDSMQPTLFDGDWVLVDKTQRRPTREGLYAIRVADDAWVKRVSVNLKSKQLRVLSDNPTTPPQPELDEEDVAIIGRVIVLVARKVA